MAKQGKEGGNCEGFVAFAEDFEIDGFAVVEKAQERGNGINRDHEEDSDDAGQDQVSGVVKRMVFTVGWMTHCRCSRGLL